MGNILTVEEVAGEGITVDERVEQTLIPLAEAVLETMLGHRFYAHDATFTLDGTGLDVLTLPQAILSITSVTVGDPDLDVPTDADEYVVRNRRPPSEDDRLWPRLEMVSGIWPAGKANITVVGRFGFTTALPDGTEVPPREIKRLCVRLVAYELARVGSLDEEMARKLQIYGSSVGVGGEMLSLASYLSAADRPERFAVPDIDNVLARFAHPATARRPKFAFGAG